MKKFIPIFIIALSVSFVACHSDRSRYEEDGKDAEVVEGGQGEETDTTKKDSDTFNATGGIKADVDSLFKVIEKQQNEINSLRAETDETLPAEYIYGISAIMFILLLLIIFVLYGKNKDRARKAKSIALEQKIAKVQNHIHQDINVSLTNLDRKLNKLEQEVKYGLLRYDLGGITQGGQEGNSGESLKEDPHGGKKEEEKKVEHVSREFYMPRTRVDRQFEDSKKKLSKDEGTFFKFTLDRKNPKKANFVFAPYDTRSITASFDDRDNSLVTACDIEVESNSPSGFKCDGSGEAELKNGIWEVTKKLKLKYV